MRAIKGLWLLFLGCQQLALAQTVIQGSVTDKETAKGVYATVVLKDDTGKIIAYTTTKNQGHYTVSAGSGGVFNLVVSSLSYASQQKRITLENGYSIQKHDFVLSPKITELNEVVVQSRRPITVKKDTVVFDAKSFLQGNEQVVEDLLKKIPGLNVMTDGTIKIGNQEVEKVMVDGDDFFEKGYKLVTKNMPVQPIDKVEVYQNYSNNKHLKGIENSEKVALNLTLKAEAKRVWFGNATGGYGVASGHRYELRGNLMNFGKASKQYFLTNLNNTGIDAVGDIKHLIRPFRFDEPASVGDNQSASAVLALNYELPALKKRRVNLNNAEMLSLNSIYTLSPKVKLKTLGFLNTDEIAYFRNSIQQFSLQNTSFTNLENFTGRKATFTGFGKVDVTYDLSKTKTLAYTGKFSRTQEQNASQLLFNSNNLREQLNATNQLIDQKAVYTHKLTEKKVWILSGRYLNETIPQVYTANQFILSDLFRQEADSTRQRSMNRMQFAGLEAHFMNKKPDGSLLEIKFGNQLRIDNLTTRLELLGAEHSPLVPEGYQNKLRYMSNDLYASAKYRYSYKQIAWITQVDAHQLYNQLINLGVRKSQHPFFIVPKMGLDWKINNKNKLLTSYTYNTTNPGVLDIYSGFVQTGFRSLSRGLEAFNQLQASNALLNYTHGNWGDKFFINTMVIYAKNHDFYSTNSIIAPNYTRSEKIIIKDREYVSITSDADYYLKPIESNFKLNVGFTNATFKNIVNSNLLRNVRNLTADYGFELRSGFRGAFNYHIGSKWSYSQIATSQRNSFTNNMSFLDMFFMINSRFNVQLQTERYLFGNLPKTTNLYYFMDLEGRYVVKENKLTLFLSGNNLFNTKTFRNFTITDINTAQTAYRLMPRYILLKAEYRF